MSIKGILFDNQAPTAKALRGGFHSALSDGILSGCDISIGSGNISFSSGLMCVAGGIFAISGGQTIAIDSNAGQYARVKAVVDLSKIASKEQFGQVYFEVDYANSLLTFQNLVQQDVNTGAGVLYEAEICVVLLNSSGTLSLVRYHEASAKIQYGDTLPENAPEGTIFLLKTS